MSNTTTTTTTSVTKALLIKYHEHIRIFKLNEGVIQENRLSSGQIKIYGYIYGWCADAGRCVTSIRALADSCSLQPSTCQLAIIRLEALGWIAVQHGARSHGGAKNVCNQYQILKTPPLKEGKKQVKKRSLSDVKTETEKKRAKIFVIDKMLSQINGLTPEEHVELINKLRYAN